ncbi:UNVERIFIED_CONTAM: hypothetical protein RMT77_005367 [Armadillidium vulgare]
MKANIAVLIQAAEYLERKEREMEHGYASTLPMPEESSYPGAARLKSHSHSHSKSNSRRVRNKSKLQNSRTTHNELEKNRRAHLRTCLEKLKELVPLGPDGSRHTTLGLLTRAKCFIKSLEEKDRKQSCQKEILEREHRHLRRRLESLELKFDYASKRRSVSESSVFSTESSGSSSSGYSNSESDEVDILGYGSNQSDTDDHSSVQSFCSDRGVILSTRRLTITEPSSFYQQNI